MEDLLELEGCTRHHKLILQLAHIGRRISNSSRVGGSLKQHTYQSALSLVELEFCAAADANVGAIFGCAEAGDLRKPAQEAKEEVDVAETVR